MLEVCNVWVGAEVVKLVVGYLFRTFSPHCTPQALNYLYKAQVLPLLDYGSIVWDSPT